MSRYAKMFEGLNARQQGAFVPFTVIGDPDLEESGAIIQTMADSGADALELGIPFSDPLADGPTIQDAMDRSLGSGVTPQDCLQLVKKFRSANPDIPIGLLVYANLVYAWGIDQFYGDWKDAGVDSVLVADVPVSESAPFCKAAIRNEVDPVLLCPPNIDDHMLEQVATQGRGYTYLLSRAGVTGTNVAASMPVETLLEKLSSSQAPPPLLGFGISQPDHVSSAIAAGARGVIVGSAIVQIIERNSGNSVQLNGELSEFVTKMKLATSQS